MGKSYSHLSLAERALLQTQLELQRARSTITREMARNGWHKFRKHKGAVKMHTLLDLHGSIPTFIRIPDGKVADVNVLDEIELEAGAFYVMDRGYIDFKRLYRFTLESAFFVVRTKTNVLLQRRYSRPVDKSTGLRSAPYSHPD